jgi:uncharacterized protein (DUF849 family)
MLIKAAINGGRKKAEHPAIPVSPDEQAAAVIECLAAGAGAIHLHVRATTGEESLQSADLSRTLPAIRAAAPAALIGVTTGAWIIPDPAARVRALAEWQALPDFASVNFSEDGAVEVAQLLLSRGVDVEAGLCKAEDAEVFLTSGLASRCLRVLLEPQEQEVEQARNAVREIETVLDGTSVNLPRLLHGAGSTSWCLLDDAIARGYDIRVGFEDILSLPDGSLATNNASLISEARKHLHSFKRLDSQ